MSSCVCSQRVRADAVDADLLDQVVAGRARHVRSRVRRPGQEAHGTGRVLHLLLERERPLVRLPPCIGRLEPLGEIGPHVQPAVRRATTEPLHGAADREVDTESRYVDGHDPGGLVAIENHVRADLVRAAHDRLDVLDLGLLEEDMADRDEKRPLVDPLHDLVAVLAHDDLEVGLRLVQVAHGREVRALVDDAIPRRVDGPEARERNRLRDRDVLLHDGRPRGRTDDAPDLIADAHRRGPPPFGPGADPALGPHPRELGEKLGRAPRHRPERVAREVRRMLENRELGAVVEKVAHPPRLID